MWHWKRLATAVGLPIPVMSLLLLAVACGSPASPATQAPQSDVMPAATAVPTSAPSPASEVTAPVSSGTLTIMVADFGNERFDGAFAAGGTEIFVRLIGGFLMSDDENRKMIPGIATEWGIAPDGLSWDFTIREGVKFHDGSDLTVDDVHWTLQHLFNEEAVDYNIGPSGGRIARDTTSIEVVGPDQITLNTSTPRVELAVVLSESAGHRNHIMPARDALHDVDVEATYDNNPVGAGPLALESRSPASSMSFERFGDFYFQPDNGLPEDRRVNFQSLELVLVPEESTRVSALQAGEVDIAPASLESREQVQAGGGRLLFAQEGIYLEGRMYGCYEAQYPCYDRRFRQALNYGVNKESIQQLYGGPEVWQIKGWDVVTPSAVGYSPGLDPWPFDPDQARQLLADAGYPNGEGAGTVVLNVAVSSVLPFMVEGAQLVADSWRKELGLDVQVNVADRSALSQQQRNGELNGQIWWRENDARVDGESIILGRFGDPDSSGRYHEDPEIYQKVNDVLSIVDPAVREADLVDLLPSLREESYQVSAGFANIPWAVGPNVVTWRPKAMALFPTALHTVTLE